MKISFDFKVIILMLSIVAFFPPSVLEFTSYGPYLDYLFITIKILITIWYGFVYLCYRKKHFFDFWIVIFLLSQIVSAILSNTITIGFIASQIFLFGFYIFLKTNIEDNPNQLLKAIFNIFLSYLLLQVITQSFSLNGFDPKYSYGDNRSYFIGRKNSATPYLLYVFVSYYILNKQMNKKVSIKEIFFISFIFVLSILTKSSTTVMCFLIAVLIRFFGIKERIGSLYTKVIAGTYILLSAVILFSENSIISRLMSTLFGKSSFSGRTQIWQLAINYFKQNFWFGYGLDISYIPWTNGVIVYSAHNTLLDILARYGIFTGTIFIVILLSFFIGENRVKSKTLLTLLITYLLYLLMENSSMLFFILMTTTVYFTNRYKGIYETDC